MNLLFDYYNVWLKGDKPLTSKNHADRQKEHYAMTLIQLEECIDIYGKDIYGFCRQITGNRQDGDDLYQDTFMKALELKDKIDIEQNPKSYLLSIAVRLWKNRRRKYAWRQRIAGMENFSDEVYVCESENTGSGNNPEEEMLIKEEKAYVMKCVSYLDEKYRLPVYLYYLAELSLKEIARILKVPEGTVKSRLHKARVIIKEKMEVAGYDR